WTICAPCSGATGPAERRRSRCPRYNDSLRVPRGMVPRPEPAACPCCACASGPARPIDPLNSYVPNPVLRFPTVSGQTIHWFLKRNCSITPSQLGWLYASLCVVSLAIGFGFWVRGARLVLPFAWLELAAVGVAFLFYARHATDGERIALQEGRL